MSRSSIMTFLKTMFPSISFENRKNEPGEVSFLFGMDALSFRIDGLVDEDT